MNKIFEEVKALCQAAGAAAPALALTDSETRNRILLQMADTLLGEQTKILAANAQDLKSAEKNGVPAVMFDRLRLTPERIAAIADAIRALTKLPDPLCGQKTFTRPTGITVTEKKVPLGVVAIIYEARPNVTADAAALCVKSGNAVVLRGGKEAIESNRALVTALKQALIAEGLDPNAIGLIESTDRESANALMQMRGLVDVLIPRGGKGLIRSCVDNAKVPVIETGAGNCHVYIDKAADLDMALAVTVNAKCQRPSVCNAAETLLLHRDIAAEFLPRFYAATREWRLELHGDEATRAILPEALPATEEDYATEYNDYIMAVKVLESVEEAVAHIARYTTKHSECIITADREAADYFLGMVDAAAVYHNASTRFTDGGEFGLGAEIGISTQKLHARGPMGLTALTTVKYVVTGNGAVRK
ncbi:MAG: glutamate-5-semialdehyde dehydrogenase [Ruminococcaceae bacterium]|nr:glutamate-5-semialdehyde dehydrogenase [Oscillospiraceae bacterium]